MGVRLDDGRSMGRHDGQRNRQRKDRGDEPGKLGERAQDARGVAWVTVENAPKLNTLHRDMMTALIAAVERLAKESRCVPWCCAVPA